MFTPTRMSAALVVAASLSLTVPALAESARAESAFGVAGGPKNRIVATYPGASASSETAQWKWGRHHVQIDNINLRDTECDGKASFVFLRVFDWRGVASDSEFHYNKLGCGRSERQAIAMASGSDLSRVQVIACREGQDNCNNGPVVANPIMHRFQKTRLGAPTDRYCSRWAILKESVRVRICVRTTEVEDPYVKYPINEGYNPAYNVVYIYNGGRKEQYVQVMSARQRITSKGAGLFGTHSRDQETYGCYTAKIRPRTTLACTSPYVFSNATKGFFVNRSSSVASWAQINRMAVSGTVYTKLPGTRSLDLH